MNWTAIVAWLAGGMMGVALIGLIHTSYLMRRNNRVYDFRMSVLMDEDLAAYEALPSYEEMMRRWWVRDLDDFRPTKKAPRPEPGGGPWGKRPEA